MDANQKKDTAPTSNTSIQQGGLDCEGVTDDEDQLLVDDLLLETKVVKGMNTKTTESDVTEGPTTHQQPTFSSETSFTSTVTNRIIQGKLEALEDIQELPVACYDCNVPHTEEWARGRPGAYAIQTVAYDSSNSTANRADREGTAHTDSDEAIVLGGAVVVSQEEGFLPLELDQQSSTDIEEALNVKALEEQSISRTASWLWLTLVLLILGTLIIALPMLLVSPSASFSSLTEAPPCEDMLTPASCNTTRTNVIPSTSPTAMNRPFIEGALSMATLRAIQDANSPLFKANLWMLQDPNLANYTQERLIQRFYLAVMYHATNGDYWHHNSNWLSYNVSECDWYFSTRKSTVSGYMNFSYHDDELLSKQVVCNGKQQLQDFVLANNNLTGDLPIVNFEEFLPYLQVFDVGNNSIATFFPQFPSGLHLEAFSVSNNNLQGGINADVLNLPRLRIIQIDGNQLYKSVIGAAIQYLPSLEVMKIGGNQYQGQLPSQLGLLAHLTLVDISNNPMLSGTIPKEWSGLRNLTNLVMSGLPGVHGTLPAEFGKLSKLRLLDMAEGTMITGAIPEPLCHQVSTGQLTIHANCSLVECCSEGTS